MPCGDVVAMKSRGGSGVNADVSVFTCDRRCNKKMSCSRHKCGQYCCVAADHQCRLVCGCEFCIFIVELFNVALIKNIISRTMSTEQNDLQMLPED